MKIYAEELRIIMDAIMAMFDGGDEQRCDAVFQALAAKTLPESVHLLCLAAANSWRLAQTVTEPGDKNTLQRSAIVQLLAAFGRLNGLAATEAYILQRNKEQLGLR